MRQAWLMTLLLFVLALPGWVLRAQVLDTLPVQRPSTIEGTHFLVGFMENENVIQASGLRLRLLIASAYPNRVTVRFPDGSEKLYQLGAYQTLPLLLPDTLELRQSETPLRRAVEVRSDLPVSVFAMSSQYTTSDSYTALPLDMWGTEYTVLSLPNDTYGDGLGTPVDPLDIRQSEFMIIASSDQTEVEFRPTATTEGGRAANLWHRVQLQRGECFLVKSFPSPQGTGDLTATMVRANKPIAVLSGHVRASLPIGLPPTLDSKDHLAEMLLPNNLLGWSYITVPFATGARLPIGDYLRAVAIEPDTRITVYTERNDFSFILADAGDTLTLPRVNSPTWWFANKPFALAQYMTTATVANAITFDPAMVIAVPMHLYVSRCVFQAPANLNDATFSRQFDRHWLNVICDERARTSLKLDGKRVADSIAPELATQAFRSSRMFWAQIPITPGMHILEADSGVFTGVLYGMGYTDSYAHVVGVTSATARDTVLPRIAVADSCSWLIGTAWDEGDSGLALVAVESDSTRNYDFRVVDQGNDRAAFRASLLDPYRDGNIAIIIRDGAGNGIRYRYRYTAPVVDLSPRPLRFQATGMGEVLCQDAVIRNFSFRDTLLVESLDFAQRGSGVFSIQAGSLPLVCPPRRQVSVQLCYSATIEGISRDTLIWNLGCGRQYYHPIEARTPRPELSAGDVDFGDVLVGDSSCRFVSIINTGTEPVRLEQLLADSALQSFRIRQPALPQTLLPGDSLHVEVCFLPVDTGGIRLQIEVVNDKSLPTRFELRGRGIRADLVAELLDCGPRRVGVRFDTVAHIHNRGTADATVRYQQQRGDVQAVLHSLAQGDLLRIPAKSSITLPIRFSPSAVGSFASVLEFSTDGGDLVQLAIQGAGTLPIITMVDTTIGPIKLGQRADVTVIVVRSEGNEALTVDSLWLDGPDRSSFRIQAMPAMPAVVPPGQAIAIPITFEPSRVGLHQVAVYALNDARPNYLRTLSAGTLRGIALEQDSSGGGPTDTTEIVDTVDFRFDVTYNPVPNRCEQAEATLIVENTGSAPLRFSSAELLDRGQPVDILGRFPAWLAPKDQTRIRIVFPPPQAKRNVTVRIVANDTLVRQRILRFDPRFDTLTVQLDSMSGVVDSTATLTIRGSINSGSTRPISVMLDLDVPANLIEYRGGATLPVTFGCGGASQMQSATVAVQADRYVAVWSIPPSATDCWWQLAVPIRFLFSLETEGTIHARVFAGDCYDTAMASATVTVSAVCGQQLRGIQLVGATIRSVTPNPFSDQVRLDVDVFSTQVLRAWAYDGIGRKYFVGERALLQTGEYVVIFDTDTLPSGWYLFVLETADGRRGEICCFFKQ